MYVNSCVGGEGNYFKMVRIKSNWSCYFCPAYVFVCDVAKSPEAAWNGGETYFLISCCLLLSNKIPTEIH